MFSLFKGLISRLGERGKNKHKKYRCPECGVDSDDPYEIFHHISQAHVMKAAQATPAIPDETLTVLNYYNKNILASFGDADFAYNETVKRFGAELVGKITRLKPH